MTFKHRIFAAILLACAMIVVPGVARAAQSAAEQSTAARAKAPQHAVSLADLQKDVATAAATRQANEAKIENFLSTPQAREAMKKAGINYAAVKQSVSQLSPDELASLAARADKAQLQFQAGALTNQQLTYIIIALATAVLIIVILTA
ncbi:MAG TPA: hypothetical protein VJN21_03220 [Candidatus Acidoferrales bacterium]|nr:hypothetical protein [Candidatus Acidoferrales bacterium]